MDEREILAKRGLRPFRVDELGTVMFVDEPPAFAHGAAPTALPPDYEARLAALDRAIRRTILDHDDEMDRTMEKARRFHRFLTDRENEE